jgi:hypothetical protein
MDGATVFGGFAGTSRRQHPFGDYGPGRWAWRLEDVKRIDAPVPARGAQTWGWSWAVPTGLSI